MPELTPIVPAGRDERASVRLGRLAERQGGVVTVAQLGECGVGPNGITRLARDGWLFQIHPGVYAVGRRSLTIEGRLNGALLYAGSPAALSHTTAGWWWGLLATAPQRIHVSTRARCRSARSIAVHHPRRLRATRLRGLVVTTVPQTLLDIAGVLPYPQLRRALAEADYKRLLRQHAVERVLGRGRRGSAALRRALEEHLPELASTRSVLEEQFLHLCETVELPPPEVNVVVEGLIVDMLWREQRVIVELDGYIAHGTASAINRDRDREMVLRAAGFLVLRYTWKQITQEPERVAAELRREFNIARTAHRTDAQQSGIAG